MNEKILGKVACPVCGFPSVLKETKKGKAYVACSDGCSQCFSRSVVGDAGLRGMAGLEVEKQGRKRVGGAGEVGSQKVPEEKAPDRQKNAVTVTHHTSDGVTTKSETTIFDKLGELLK